MPGTPCAAFSQPGLSWGDSGDALPGGQPAPSSGTAKGGEADAVLGKVSSSWVTLHKSRKEAVPLSRRPGPTALRAAAGGWVRRALQGDRAGQGSHGACPCTHWSHPAWRRMAHGHPHLCVPTDEHSPASALPTRIDPRCRDAPRRHPHHLLRHHGPRCSPLPTPARRGPRAAADELSLELEKPQAPCGTLRLGMCHGPATSFWKSPPGRRWRSLTHPTPSFPHRHPHSPRSPGTIPVLPSGDSMRAPPATGPRGWATGANTGLERGSWGSTLGCRHPELLGALAGTPLGFWGRVVMRAGHGARRRCRSPAAPRGGRGGSTA